MMLLRTAGAAARPSSCTNSGTQRLASGSSTRHNLPRDTQARACGERGGMSHGINHQIRRERHVQQVYSRDPACPLLNIPCLLFSTHPYFPSCICLHRTFAPSLYTPPLPFPICSTALFCTHLHHAGHLSARPYPCRQLLTRRCLAGGGGSWGRRHARGCECLHQHHQPPAGLACAQQGHLGVAEGEGKRAGGQGF